MNTMTSSSFMSFDFDIQAVFHRTGADILMFLTAMLVYFVLHRVKTSAASSKASSKEYVIKADQESPSQQTKSITKTQLPPLQVITVEPGPPQPDVAAQRQPAVAAKETTPKLIPINVEQRPSNAIQSVGQLLSSMRHHAASRNIKETLKAFRLIEESGECMTSSMYNTVLQAWVSCGNIWAVENFMEEVREAGRADETSFAILIKALVMVREAEKARLLLDELKEVSPCPSSAIVDELLFCFARAGLFNPGAGLFNDGISVLKHMNDSGLTPTPITLCAAAKLVNGARAISVKCSDVQQALSKCDFESKNAGEASQNYPSELPRLAVVIAQAGKSTSTKCVHDVEIKGSAQELKALQRTLTQDRSLDYGNCAWPPDCHYDKQQDELHRAQIAAVLRCVSKQGLGMPSHLDRVMLEYLGSDVYFLRLNFESNSIHAPMLDEMSYRYPRLGFRHCWVKPTFGSCGQRTFSYGEEIDESSFNRHIKAPTIREIKPRSP